MKFWGCEMRKIILQKLIFLTNSLWRDKNDVHILDRPTSPLAPDEKKSFSLSDNSTLFAFCPCAPTMGGKIGE